MSLAQPFADLWTVRSLQQWGFVGSCITCEGRRSEGIITWECMPKSQLLCMTWHRGMSERAQRSTGRATAGRHMLLNKAALNESLCGFLHLLRIQAWALPFCSWQQVLPCRVLLQGMGAVVEQQQQQSASHSKCLRLSRASLGIYEWIMSLPSQLQK